MNVSAAHHGYRQIAWLTVCVFIVMSIAASARAGVVTGQWSYLEDPAGELNPGKALARLREGQGIPFDSGRFSLGNSDSRYWLKVTVSNEGAESVRQLLDVGMPFRAHLQVYMVAESQPLAGNAIPLLRTGEWERYTERSSLTLTLHTPEFELAPGASIDLLLDYHTRGATFLPLQVKSPKQFFTEQSGKEVRDTFFYSCALVLLLVFFIFGLAMRDKIVLGYAGLYALMLLFIAAVEGFGYQYLWPRHPHWNQYSSLYLMLFCTGYSFILSRFALAPTLRPRWVEYLLLALAGLAFLLCLATEKLPFAELAEFAGLLIMIALLVQLVTVCSWLSQAVSRNLVSVTAILLTVPVSVALLVLSRLGFDLPDLVLIYGGRLSYFVSIVFTLGALATHVLALRYDYEQSLEEALRSAQRDARLSRDLYESRREYERVQRIADRWKRHYADTSHDIRQPLLSMRAALAGGNLQRGSDQWRNLVRSLDYLEALSAPNGEMHPDTGEVNQANQDGEDPYPAELIISTITRMFSEEASQRGVQLRSVNSTYMLQVAPLVIMRILSNLVANAIKHAGRGDVLLGCRRSSSGLRFDVIDNGDGIPQQELSRLQQPYQKGSASAGEGLGLAICWQLAAQQGFELSVQSREGSGTCFSLFLPHAAQPSVP